MEALEKAMTEFESQVGRFLANTAPTGNTNPFEPRRMTPAEREGVARIITRLQTQAAQLVDGLKKASK